MNNLKDESCESNKELDLSGTHSLLKIHDSMLENGLSSDLAENERIEAMKKVPLKVDVKNKKTFTKSLWLPTLAALAASVALYVFNQNSEEEEVFSVKGGTHISVIVDHGGKRSPFSDAKSVVSGDKINAEVIAPESSVGVTAVFDRSGRILSFKEDFKTNVIDLAAGTKKFFPVAVELIGESDGEVLGVAICNKKEFNARFQGKESYDKLFTSVQTVKQFQDALGPFCYLKLNQLRI